MLSIEQERSFETVSSLHFVKHIHRLYYIIATNGGQSHITWRIGFILWKHYFHKLSMQQSLRKKNPAATQYHFLVCLHLHYFGRYLKINLQDTPGSRLHVSNQCCLFMITESFSFSLFSRTDFDTFSSVVATPALLSLQKQPKHYVLQSLTVVTHP